MGYAPADSIGQCSIIRIVPLAQNLPHDIREEAHDTGFQADPTLLFLRKSNDYTDTRQHGASAVFVLRALHTSQVYQSQTEKTHTIFVFGEDKFRAIRCASDWLELVIIIYFFKSFVLSFRKSEDINQRCASKTNMNG